MEGVHFVSEFDPSSSLEDVGYIVIRRGVEPQFLPAGEMSIDHCIEAVRVLKIAADRLNKWLHA